MGQKRIVHCAFSGRSERRQVFEMSDLAGVYFEKWSKPTEVWWLELPQNRFLSCMSFTRRQRPEWTREGDWIITMWDQVQVQREPITEEPPGNRRPQDKESDDT